MRERILPAIREFEPQMIIYIAGNDVIRGDRLGSFSLSPEGVFARDQEVVKCARICEAGLAITLAGGYSPLAWQASANLIRYLLTDDTRVVEWAPDVRERFRQLSRERHILSPHGKEGSWIQFSESDLLADLERVSPPLKFLDYPSAHAAELALEHFGILSQIRKKGFQELEVSLHLPSPGSECLRIHGRKNGTTYLLVELVVHLERIPMPGAPEDFANLLMVDWLLIQDPSHTHFPPERPKLPGQEYPGLGISEAMLEFLVQACLRLKLDGIATLPSYYHNASIASRSFRFLDPKAEGELLALKQRLGQLPIAQASHLIEQKAVKVGDQPLIWQPRMHILPLSPALLEHFESSSYCSQVHAEVTRLQNKGLHL